MTTIAVLHTKGGTGKSTVSLQLALTRAYLGHTVWIVDGDVQGSSQQAIAQRVAAGRLPAVPVTQIADGQALINAVLTKRSDYENVVIDAGGRDSSAMRAALMIADVVIVPVAPRSMDIWAAGDMVALAKQALAKRKTPVRLYALINQADSRGQDNKDAAAAMADLAPLEVLDCIVGRRKSIAEASASGLSVLEMAGTSPESRHEIRTLTNAIYD